MKKLLPLAFIIPFFFSCKKTYVTDTYVTNDTTIVRADTTPTIYPALNTGWQASIDGNNVRYRMIDSVIYISGLTAPNSLAGITIFILDSAFRPKYEIFVFGSDVNGTQVPIQIFPDGQVVAENPPINDAVSLDNISFPVK